MGQDLSGRADRLSSFGLRYRHEAPAIVNSCIKCRTGTYACAMVPADLYVPACHLSQDVGATLGVMARTA